MAAARGIVVFQTGLGVHIFNGYRVLSWGEATGREVDHSCLVPRLRMSGAIPPLRAFMSCAGSTLPFFFGPSFMN
jgi:hypothetical protein